MRYHLTGHSGHHQKDLQRIITAENIERIKSFHSHGGNVNGKVTMENSMEVP